MASVSTGEAESRSPAQHAAEASYRAADYEAAAVALAPIARGELPGDAARARFWLGKSLTMLGLHASALTVFDPILAQGPRHPYHRLTLPWLVALSRELPEGAEVVRRLGEHAPPDLDDPVFDGVRDELYTRLGWYHLQRGDYAKAIALLRQMPKQSPDYGRARLYLGIAFTLEYDGESALNAFKDARRHIVREHHRPVRYTRRRRRDGTTVPTQGEVLDRLDDAIGFGMANVFYMVGHFDAVRWKLDRVASGTARDLEAMLWRAWAEFRMAEIDEENFERHYDRALGPLHVLNSPFFEEHLHPEAFVLQAGIYAAACRYDSAWRIADRFDRRHGPVREVLRKMLEQAPGDRMLYRRALEIEDQRSSLDPRMEEVVLTLLADPKVRSYFRYVQLVEREQEQLDRVLGSRAAAGLRDRLGPALASEASLARDRAGAELRDRLAQAIGEIGDAEAQLRQLRAKLEPLRQAHPEPRTHPRRKRPRPNSEREIYRYTGEYWQDELESYHFEGIDICEPEP